MKYKIDQCIASRLRRLSRITDGYLRKALKDFDITENQMNILFALFALGKVDQGEIGKRLILERSTVSRGIKILENKKYITKSSSYRPEIELTKNGRELVKKMDPVWQSFMNEVCSKIGKDGMDSIKKIEQTLI